MPTSPAVSVVVPCRDQARYLRAALHSVAAQNFDAIETIVVDDGSTDDTSAVATASGARLIRQQNLGVSEARNRGLREAHGQYVVFLDADDELEPDAVRTGVAVLQQRHDAWMVARCCVLIDEAGRELPTNCSVPESNDLYREWLHRNLVWTPGAAVFRRGPMLTLQGFPVDVGPAADYAVYLTLSRLNRVVFDDRVAVRYRQHGTNMSRDAARMLRAVLAVLHREQLVVPEQYRAEFRQGLRDWCLFYGDEIIQQLRLDIRARRFGRPQMEAIALLLSHCRSLAVTHLARKLRRVARGHPPAQVEPGRFSPPSRPSAPNLTSAERRS